MKKITPFWTKATMLPPIMIRLLAKEGPKPLTTEQIAERSGLSPERITSISWLTTWGGVDIVEMEKFLKACDRDFMNYRSWKAIQNYIKNPAATFKFLQLGEEYEALLKPLSEKYARHLQAQADD